MDAQTGLLILVVVLIGLFILGRELTCWYLKINRLIEVLESIDESLKTLPTVARLDQSGQRIHKAY